MPEWMSRHKLLLIVGAVSVGLLIFAACNGDDDDDDGDGVTPATESGVLAERGFGGTASGGISRRNAS